MSFNRIALLLFLVWEAGWAYSFFTAPVPDEAMQSVFALLMGVVLPLMTVLPIALAVLAHRLTHPKQ